MANPVLLLEFEGGTGASVVDTSISASTWTFEGTGASISATTPILGASSLTVGGAGYIKTTSTAFAYPVSSDHKIVFRFKTTQTGGAGTWPAIIANNDGAFLAGAVAIYSANSTGAVGGISIWDKDFGDSVPLLTGGSGLNDGNPHYVEWSKNGNVHRLFIDGVQVDTRTASYTRVTSSQPTTIGAEYTGSGTYSRFYVGTVDDLAFDFTVGGSTSSYTVPAVPYFVPPSGSGSSTITITAFGYEGIPSLGSGSVTLPSPTGLGWQTNHMSGAASIAITASGSGSSTVYGGSVIIPITASGYGGGGGKASIALSASGSGMTGSVGRGASLITITAFGVGHLEGAGYGKSVLPSIKSGPSYGGGGGSSKLAKVGAFGAGLTGSNGSGAVIIKITGRGNMSGEKGGYGAVVLPRIVASSSSRGSAKIYAPKGSGTGRTFIKWRLVAGIPVELFDQEIWSINLRHRDGTDPEQGYLAECTNWTNFPAKKIFKHGGRYFFIGIDGSLNEMKGKTDNGLPIAWDFKTASTDFESIQFKTPKNMYLGGRVENGFSVDVFEGEDDETSYQFSSPVTTGPANSRAEFASGLRDRYYGFKVSNSGGTVDVDTLNVELHIHERAK